MSTAGRHARLTQLFGEAVELDAPARDALIARVRGEDADLARELVELLDADSKPGLVTTALVPAAELAELRRDATPIAPDVPGYTLGELLGEGGMGTVYAAEQVQPKRRVAIKVLHARSAHAVMRFELEAAAMAKLDHPGIARVLEAGDAGGRPYIAMEYVEGESLDTYAAKQPLRARLELFVAICDAVHHAHVKGVFHRDLKPANVRVRPDGAPVVLDFGVARLAGDALDAGTRAGELIGTPLYMSPEQARLEPQAVDARGDVYTLGVMLYELAANALPYGERGMPLPALARAITETPPIPLGKHAVALRGDLEAITGTALEKEPDRRYPSVAALAADVRHYLANEPVSVRVPGMFERARRYLRRRPVVAAALAAGVLGTATFAIVVTLLWLDARDARHTAEAASVHSEAARAALAAETARLELRQARDALARDPTEALAWVAAAGSDADVDVAHAIADEAVARGVSADVLHASSEEVHWIEPTTTGFITSSYDGRVLAWESGATPRLVFQEPKGRVHLATASATGVIAIGGDHGALDLVRLDGTRVRSLAGNAGDVQHLAWHDSWLASGDDHGNALLWRTDHGDAQPVTLIATKATIGDVAFGGGFALAGDYGGTIALVELATGKRRTATISAGVLALWCDGRMLVAIDDKGTLHRWRLDGDVLVPAGEVATGAPLKRAAFAANGLAAVGTVDGDVMRITGDRVERLAHFRAQVRSLVVRADGTLAAGSDRGELVYIRAGRNTSRALLGGGRVRHLAFARDGAELLASDSEGNIRRWVVADGPATLLASPGPVVDKLVARDGIVAAVDANGELATWQLATGARTRVGHVEGRVEALAVANGVAITGSEGSVTIWSTPPVVRSIHGHVTAIAIGADRIAVATSHGAVALFTFAGEPRGEVAGHAGGTEAVAFDRTGTTLVSGGQDRTVRVWRPNSSGGDDFVAAAALTGPEGDTHHVAIAGERIIAAGNDGRVLAWSLHDGSASGAPQVLARHTGAVLALVIDGEWLASAGRDAQLARVRLSGADASTAALRVAAVALAIDARGVVHAALRDGSVVRWSDAPKPIVDHGVHAALALDGDRWLIATTDGALWIESLADPSAAAVAELLRATSYRDSGR